jgi:hypothetical protein
MSAYGEALITLLAIFGMVALAFIGGAYIGFRTGYAARNAELKGEKDGRV